MVSLQGKKIILGISGSIAAYKTPQLVRLLVKEGAEVQVIMTEQAKKFVTPLVLSTVSLNPVMSAIQDNNQWENHVHIGRSADLFVMAPCSANTMAKMAQGLCDNLLLAAYLSATCPVIIAPAMDEDMWHHPATKNNINTLNEFGYQILPVGTGELASGLSGEGRMAEPDEITNYVKQHFQMQQLSNNLRKKALITAGPTYEAIDPVRFLGNYSTGKMGTALALSLADIGYEVNLIAGPGVVAPQHVNIHAHTVVSTQEMFAFCLQFFEESHITIMAAAVSDFKPVNSALQKIKKIPNQKSLALKLVQTTDILAHLGQIKKSEQILVGFALETENELANALKKRKSKQADFIVLNSLNDAGSGFGTDTNKVTILSSNGEKIALPLQSKTKTAKAIISHILR